MKEATLTSAHVVGKSTRNVDYSSINWYFSHFICKTGKFAKTVISFIASEQFATVVAIAGALGIWVAAVTSRPVLLAVSTIVAMVAILRVTIPTTKGGKDE